MKRPKEKAMNESTQSKSPPVGLSLGRAIPLIALALVAAFGLVLWGDAISLDALRDNRERLLAWRDQNLVQAAALYFVLYVAIVAFSLPGASIMTLTGGFMFGLAIGSTLTVFAATIGACIIFVAARVGLGDVLYRKMSASNNDGAFSKIEKGLRENEVSYLLLMRLVPAIPFFVANLAPAFLGVSLRRFAITTFFGIIPGTVVYTWIGVGLGDVFDRGGTPDLGIIFEPHVIGPILGLAGLAALPIIVRRFRSGDHKQ